MAVTRPRIPTALDAGGDPAKHRYLLELYRNATDFGDSFTTGSATTILDAAVIVFDGDGSGAARLYYAGEVALQTNTDGAAVVDPTASGTSPRIRPASATSRAHPRRSSCATRSTAAQRTSGEPTSPASLPT